MRTALDIPTDSLDQNEQVFVANVREHGWFRTSVFEDEVGPGFSYSTGFWISGQQPELIMFSMKPEIVHDVFWNLFGEGKAVLTLPVGQRTDIVFANLPAYAFPVAEIFYADYLGWSRWFYGGNNFPCLQIVWPDRGGVFPWEAGFDTGFHDAQPDLTEHGWSSAVLD